MLNMTDPGRSVGEVTTRFHTLTGPFTTQGGDTIEEVTLAYELYGEVNETRDNVIVVFHAITGSQHAAGINRECGRDRRALDSGGSSRLVGRVHRTREGDGHGSICGAVRQLSRWVLRLHRSLVDQSGDGKALRLVIPEGHAHRHRRLAGSAAG
jgi:hypothetical protein